MFLDFQIEGELFILLLGELFLQQNHLSLLLFQSSIKIPLFCVKLLLQLLIEFFKHAGFSKFTSETAIFNFKFKTLGSELWNFFFEWINLESKGLYFNFKVCNNCYWIFALLDCSLKFFIFSC